MNVYELDGDKLKDLNEKPFKLEKEIQQLFESNLETLTGFRFVKSEFTIKDRRIDTLAFDTETKSFVIIEYKREKNFSVIDQGVSYLNLMLEYKSDFIVEYNESNSTALKATLKRNEVDWSQSRVIFVSPSFTVFQRQAVNFKDLPIELWEIKRFENNVVVINPVKKSASAPSIKQVKSTKANNNHDNHNANNTDEGAGIDKIAQEIITYDEAYHLYNKSEDIIELYEAFKASILNLDNDIELIYRKPYIAFKKKRNLVDVCVMKHSLKLWLNQKSGMLDDPKGLARDVSSIGHLGNGDYEVIVQDTKDLEYIMSLIKQGL